MRTKLNQYLKYIAKYKSNSILTKLMSSYIIILATVLIFQILVYFSLRTIMVEKSISNTTDYLTYYSSVTDEYMIILKESAYILLQDINTGEGSGNINLQINTVKELKNFVARFSFVEGAIIYNDSSNSVITNNGTFNKHRFVTDLYKLSPIPTNEIMEEFESNIQFSYLPPVDMNLLDIGGADISKRVLTFHFGTSYSDNKNRIILLINEDFLTHNLKFQNMDELLSIHVLSDENKEIATSKNAHYLTDDILSLITSSPDKYQSFEHKNSVVVYYRSAFEGWQYVTVLDTNIILHSLNRLKSIFLILMPIMFIMCLVISWRFVKLYYFPISYIVNQYVLTIGKNKNELQSITETLDKLYTENKRYAESKLLSGIVKSGFYISEIAEVFKYPLFKVILVIAGKDTDLLGTFAQVCIFENVGPYITKYILEGPNRLCIIFNCESADDEVILQNIIRIKNKYQQENSVFLCIGVGDFVSSISEIHKSNQAAYDYIMQGNNYNEDYIYAENKNHAANFSIYFPINLEKEITACIFNQNITKLKFLINEVFDKNQGIPNIYMRNVMVSFIGIYINLSDRSISGGIKSSQSILDYEFRSNALRDYTVELFTELRIENTKETRIDGVKDFVLDFIHQNYSDSTISIEMIAGMLNFSSAYISTLFKRATGIAFSQYLLNYRIEKARELLENTNEKVKDISEKVGFGTYNNFVRMFRKKMGVTPSEYRNK